MNQAGSKYINEWLDLAEKDWNRVEILLEHGDEERAAFHLQQALEKYLKGFLLANGWELKRIHDLELLLEEASTSHKDTRRWRHWTHRKLTCKKISQGLIHCAAN